LNALLVKYYAMLCRENAQEHEDTSNHKPGAANTLNAKQTQKTEAAATPSFAIKANAADSCEALLDDSRRPKWYHTSQAATISGKGLEDTTKPTDVISSDLEIRPFIDKSAPNILALKTANGLDKLFVDSCWNSIKGYSTSNNNSSNFINVGTLGNTNKSATHMKAAQATKLQLPNQSTVASGSDRSSARGGAGSSSRKSSSRSARPNTSRDSARGTGGGGGNTSGRLVPVAGIPVGSARPSTTSGDHAGRGKHGNGDALTNDTRRQSNLAAVLSTAQVQQQQQAQQRLTTMMAVAAATDNAQKEIKAEKDASRQIAKLAKTTAHDIHFALLGNMDSLLHRQLNQGERDLLVEGLRIEGEEDFDRAHIFYSRAGMHSHEKHLSKIFLGCLSYKRKSFLSAIRYFSTAICIHQNNASDYGSWYRVSSGTDSANEAQRAKAPLSVTSDKEMSKRNVYSEEFDAKHLPLDGDYDGDVAVVNGIALKHGCSNDIRTSWANTGNEIKQFVGREQALTAELLRHKLITRSNDDNTRRIVGGKAKMISAGKKERKKRAISASSSSNHNVHLVGTALEFLAN
jgi:hypothetical protein